MEARSCHLQNEFKIFKLIITSHLTKWKKKKESLYNCTPIKLNKTN